MATPSRIYKQYLSELGLAPTATATLDKDKMTRANFYTLFNKTAQMFEYDNLPYSLPAVALERILQFTGAATIVRIENTPVGHGPSFASYLSMNPDDTSPPIYAFPVNFADAPDPYGEPYKVIVTSPGFDPTVSATYELNKDAAIIRSDTYMRGLAKLHWKYAALLTEAEISLQSTLVTLRDHMTFVVRTTTQKRAVDQYLADLAAGKYGAIMSADLGTPMEPISHDGRSNAVELAVNGIQAIKSAWYNEIGLNPSFSLKREYTSAQEIDTNTDLLLPAIDDMLECRRRGVEQINAIFGTTIAVRKSSAWRIKEQETELTLAQDYANIVAAENASQQEEGETDAGDPVPDDTSADD